MDFKEWQQQEGSGNAQVMPVGKSEQNHQYIFREKGHNVE